MIARVNPTGTNMTRKIIHVCAVAIFALAGGSFAMTGNAFAKGGRGPGGGPGGSFHAMTISHETHRDHGPDRDIRRDHDVHHDGDLRDAHRHDRDHDGRFVYRHDHDHSRHFWHGTWYEYGVGPCWRWSDDYDEYVWVCE
jgi:hypothetical protein